jgi:hypothetical protein
MQEQHPQHHPTPLLALDHTLQHKVTTIVSPSNLCTFVSHAALHLYVCDPASLSWALLSHNRSRIHALPCILCATGHGPNLQQHPQVLVPPLGT